MLALQREVWPVPCIDCGNPLESEADARKLRRHMGKPVGGSIEVDDQTLHFFNKTFFLWRSIAHAEPESFIYEKDLVFCQ
ncbi:hypothetical protein LB516_02580 [Mesorhizobium sp. CO1-1-7]|nr:hypothetical protein [Mesorhizobium sp. CO1-1-7]